MHGCITTRHLFTHAGTIIREFGLRVYVRALYRSFRADPHTTFLDCL